MLRRAVLLGFLTAVSLTSPVLLAISEDEWTKRLITFNNLFCRYFKKYWGCQPGEMEFNNCRPLLGVRDYKLEEEMVKAWDKLVGDK